MLAAIPYTTFPEIDLGPLSLRTFGVMVALGAVGSALLGARLGERFGVPAEDTTALTARLVLWGVIGARLTWVVSNLDEIDSPLDVVAVWEGGLQFSGGLVLAALVGIPVYRRWAREGHYRMYDVIFAGLALGQCLGRVGCYAVGEHLGRESTTFFLATRYDGGPTREGPPLVGQVIHNTALYEFLHLAVLVAVLVWIATSGRFRPGTGIGVFLIWVGTGRFLTDFLRGYDEEVLGLTGAQYVSMLLVPLGVFVLVWFCARLAAAEARLAGEAAAEAPSGSAPAGA